MMAPVSDHDSFVIHSGTTIEYADDVFLALIGAESRDHLIGTDLTELIAPEFHDRLQTQINRVSLGEAPALGLAVELQPRSGTQRDAIAVSSPVEWDGADQIQTTFLTLAGETLTASYTMRSQAMEKAPIGITISDPSQPDNPIIYANDGFCELTGYPRDEVLGRNCRFLQGAETRDEPVAEMRKAIDAEEPVTVELRNYRKDGSMFWNRVTIRPISDHSGVVRYYVGFQVDITDTKMYAHERELFKEQAEIADHAMFITDRDGTIEYVNPAFERITGYTVEEAIGQTPRILKSGQQDEKFYEDLWETITTGDIWEAELTNETKDGEQYEVTQRIIPITDDRGEITHFAAIEADITDRRLREQTIDVLNRILRHNLRSAITVIDGYAKMLDSEIDDADRQAAVQAIQEETLALRKIADKTATIRSITERDRASAAWDIADLQSLARRYQDQYPHAQIELRIDVAEEVQLPASELIEIVLDEAIENAVIHSDQDQPTIMISVGTVAGSDRIEITVADDGPGIPDYEQETIESGAETPLTHGSGIGLWLIEWVTARLGGDFEIAENKPRGAKLTFHLPTLTTDPS